MIKGITIRLHPDEKQEQLLWKHVNCARFVWNYGLRLQQERFKNKEKHLSGYDLRKEIIALKKTDDFIWLNEISSHTTFNICLDLDGAYGRFFKKVTGKPKFKKKNRCKNSFPVRQDNLYFKNNCAVVEKIGKIKYQSDYKIPQGRFVYKFSNPRIKFENNKWIMTIGMEYENQVHNLTDKKMGIDLGVKELAVVSFGTENIVFKNINKTKRVKTLKHKLKHLQKDVNRKYETNNKNKVYDKKWSKSNGIKKLENQIKDIHCKLSNIRKNHIHQSTNSLVKLLPYKITMEDLNISGMMKNRHLSKAIAEQCLYEFTRQIKYKCEFNGIEFVQVDRFYPSSKTCSCCGSLKKDLKLKDRVYKCNCGLEIDRDYNAAINLMNYSNV